MANNVLVNEKSKPITTKYNETHYKIGKKEEILGFTSNYKLNMPILSVQKKCQYILLK